MADEHNQESSYELIMPFVVCSSNGGPFEDDAFVAGYECGYIDHLLETKMSIMIERYVRSQNIPQLELITMRHGYTMKAIPWEDHPEEWTRIIVARNTSI